MQVNNSEWWSNKYGVVHPTAVGMPTEEQKKQFEEYFNGLNNKYPKEDEQKYSAVDKPKHYMLFEDQGIEVRDLMKLLAEQLDDQYYSGMLVSDYIQAMQYLLRWHNKNGVEDIRKAQFYLNEIVESLEEDE